MMNTSNSNRDTNEKKYSVDEDDEVFDGDDDEYGNFIDFDDTATTTNNGDNNSTAGIEDEGEDEKGVGDETQVNIRDRDRDYSRTGMGGLSLEDNSNLNSPRYSNSNSNGINNNDINDDNDDDEVTDYCILLDNAMSSTMTIPMTIPRLSAPASDQLLRITSSNTTKNNYFSDCRRLCSAATATITATSRSGSQSLYNYFRNENDIDLDSEEEEAKKWRIYTEQQQHHIQDYQEEEYVEDMETLDDIYNDLLRRRREYHPSENENDVGNDRGHKMREVPRTSVLRPRARKFSLLFNSRRTILGTTYKKYSKINFV